MTVSETQCSEIGKYQSAFVGTIIWAYMSILRRFWSVFCGFRAHGISGHFHFSCWRQSGGGLAAFRRRDGVDQVVLFRTSFFCFPLAVFRRLSGGFPAAARRLSGGCGGIPAPTCSTFYRNNFFPLAAVRRPSGSSPVAVWRWSGGSPAEVRRWDSEYTARSTESNEASHYLMATVPSGFHFTPTKEEILNKFLTKKAKGQPFRTRLVVEKIVYENQSEPWDVFTVNDPWLPDGGGEFSKRHVLHVYTKVSCVSKETKDGCRGKNVKRKSGHGTWSGQSSYDVYDRNQQLIGHCNKFTYEPDKKWLDMDTMRKDYGSWTMHEYSLKGINGSSDYVYCKIMVNLNSNDGSVPGLLNDGMKVIEQEDMVALNKKSSENYHAVGSNLPPPPSAAAAQPHTNSQNKAPTSVFPFLPPMISDQGRVKLEGNIYVKPERNIVSNNGWTPEFTYGYNEAASPSVYYPNLPPAAAADQPRWISVYPPLAPIMSDQGSEHPDTNIVSNNGWTPEFTYGYNEAASEDYNAASSTVVYPNLAPIMYDQGSEYPETNIVSNNGWIPPESTYSYNEASSSFPDDDTFRLFDDNEGSRKKYRYGADSDQNNTMSTHMFEQGSTSGYASNFIITIGEDENGDIYLGSEDENGVMYCI